MNILETVSLKPYNTFRVDAVSRYFTRIQKLEDVQNLARWYQHSKTPVLFVGGGSNLLFKEDYPGLVAHCELSGKTCLYADESARYIRAGAGENWHDFVRWTIDQGYAGLENLSLIPGTVGAAPVQNIGAYGVELVDYFYSLDAVDMQTGEVCQFDVQDCQFSYRDSFFKSIQPGRYFITAVTFRLPKQPEWKLDYAGLQGQLDDHQISARRVSDLVSDIRRSKLPDPAVMGNAGSFFKNPVLEEKVWLEIRARFPEVPGYPQKEEGLIKTSAAWLIDQCGLKGYRVGAAGVSEQHALVLVNHGGATGKHIWSIAETLIRAVEDRFSVTLEPEPRVIG